MSPSGPGTLNGRIPESRTSVPYNLVTDLSGLGSVIEHYNIPQLEKALNVGSQDFNGTNVSETTSAFQGLADISRVIGNEGPALATIAWDQVMTGDSLRARKSLMRMRIDRSIV